MEITNPSPSLPNAWINEFHYDNAGTDGNEFVEIIIETPNLYTLSDFRLDLYNGNGGGSYDTKNVGTDLTTGSTYNEGGSSFTLYYVDFPSNGIQNGPPDGLALSYQLELIQFISYEGTILATDGPANTSTSIDIGVLEGSETSLDWSLGLIGTGTQYSDFTWDTLKDYVTRNEKFRSSSSSRTNFFYCLSFR